MKAQALRGLVFLLLAGTLAAQEYSALQEPGFGPPDRSRRPPPHGMPPPGRPRDGGFGAGVPGRWWVDHAVAQRLKLTEEQRNRIEEIFQNSRLRLIDLSAALQKEEATLEFLLGETRLDESKVLTQVDRVAAARAELEKANGRMLFGFRSVLDSNQWRQLQADRAQPPPYKARP